MSKRREKVYTDYSYVTRYELRRILNLSDEGVDFLLRFGQVLATVFKARKKYVLGHVRRAQDALAVQQNARVLQIMGKIKPASRSNLRKAQ